MERSEADKWLYDHRIYSADHRADMLDLAHADGLSNTERGVYVTYDLNASAGFECWDARHGQTLKFRVNDLVTSADGCQADVIGYTSFAAHLVALKGTDGRQWSEHESTLTLSA